MALLDFRAVSNMQQWTILWILLICRLELIHSALSVRGRLQKNGTSGITGNTEEACWTHTCVNTCGVVVLPLETRTFLTLILLTLLYFGHRLDVANLQVAYSLYTLHFMLTLWHLPRVVCLSFCNNKMNMKKSKIVRQRTHGLQTTTPLHQVCRTYCLTVTIATRA